MLTLFGKDKSKQIVKISEAFYKVQDKKSKKERFATEQELREKCNSIGQDILKGNFLNYSLS